MSWYRKVKSIYSISFVTISFIIWSTLSKWLFQNPVEYKLFLICSCLVLFTQYNASGKHNKIFVILPLGVSVIASVIFFNGQAIVLNAIYLLFATFTIYLLEDAPIVHSQYKEDINKSMVLLIFVWIISFSLGLDFVDEIYKFHILYIIMVIILMRETQRYVNDIKSKTSMVTNIIIGISILTLSLDYAGKCVKGVLDMLMDLISFILFIILTLLSKIFGFGMGLISGLNWKLQDETIVGERTIKNGGAIGDQSIDQLGIDYLHPMLILVFKILIILIVLYLLYKFLTRFRSKDIIYNGFIEEKERIVKKNKKKHWGEGFFGRVISGDGSNRDKILYTYKGFEKITEQADIYKTYMTATQLENVTKVVVDNFDDLEQMTAAYNEAKFSVHVITEEQMQLVKKGYKNIKRQL